MPPATDDMAARLREAAEHVSAYCPARERIASSRRAMTARAEADRVHAKHGSRRSGLQQESQCKSRLSSARRNTTQRSLLPEE